MSSDDLLEQLRSEYTEHVAQQEQEKKHLADNRRRFPRQDATAQLLLKAADKLLQDRAALEDSRFEEHTADLPALCRRLGIDLNKPKAEKASTGFFSLRMLRRAGVQPVARRYQVLRNADFVSVITPEMVVGDLLYLKGGDCAPCDVRVLKMQEDTQIDISLGGACSEIRDCAVHCTSADSKSSNNIILEGSWILQGSLLAVVIRPPTDPPHCGMQDHDQDSDFTVETLVPYGLSEQGCQTMFSNLWTKASCVCRSYEVMLQLASAQVVMIFLTEDLRKDAALQDTVRDLHGLGKAVLLIVGDSGVACRLADDLKLKFVTFEAGAKLTPSTGVSSMGSSFDLSLEGHNAVVAADTHPFPRHGHDEQCLADLISSCRVATTPGAVIHGMSEAMLVQLCTMAKEDGLNPLYAASQPQSQLLRALSESSSRSQAHSVSITQVTHFPSKASQESPERAKAAVADDDYNAPHNLTDVFQALQFASMSKQVEENAKSKRQLPVAVVSLNARGILAETCSCAFLRSDLRCLGHAMQLTARAVPKVCFED